jgi:hypothetical protein
MKKMERAKFTWDGQANAPKPKGPEPLKNMWGSGVNDVLMKKETPDPERKFTQEELDNFDEQFEALHKAYTDPTQSEWARDRANRRAGELIIEKQGGNQIVNGSAEAFSSGHSRVIGEAGAPSQAGAGNQFTRCGFSAKKKNAYELTHKDGAK